MFFLRVAAILVSCHVGNADITSLEKKVDLLTSMQTFVLQDMMLIKGKLVDTDRKLEQLFTQIDTLQSTERVVGITESEIARISDKVVQQITENNDLKQLGKTTSGLSEESSVKLEVLGLKVDEHQTAISQIRTEVASFSKSLTRIKRGFASEKRSLLNEVNALKEATTNVTEAFHDMIVDINKTLNILHNKQTDITTELKHNIQTMVTLAASNIAETAQNNSLNATRLLEDTLNTCGDIVKQLSVDGSWGEWGEWSQCSQSCDNGTQSRGRSCDTPSPTGIGANCTGTNHQSQGCFELICPPADCSDLLKIGRSGQSGVYSIVTWKTNTHVDVFCDMDTEGGGWTVLQHRVNGSVDFYRNFTSYEDGFGSLHGEFWLGLRLLNELTSRRNNNTLRIDLQAPNGTRMYDVYDGFSVGPGSDYTLHLVKRIDSLHLSSIRLLSPYHDGQAFSTYDRDMDQSGANCAVLRHGGWWYNRCYRANLNGHYLVPGTSNDKGMIYESFALSISLQESKMMFK